MKERVTRVSQIGGRRAPAYETALVELGVYFHGSRGKLRLVGFICQVLVASAIVFTLISLVEMGSLLLHAILVVAQAPLLVGDNANVIFANLSARDFIIDASDAFVRDSPFIAVASVILTITAEIYWTRRRASRLMPPSRILEPN
ncbi:hypothetical protein [Cupriavidus sp. UYPR2.512]|uniref:hypothetical protein n=1 Tax=Cupriavidus sp. UYPR2.512 TaxID=1080187 RepID=UPI0012F98114|nr:hypothetical protein [Cupriavidus sp. UYPR2.512]UIF89443.1 hypothetical protein KAF44_29690 [Cupriavidus necator]